MRTRFKDTFVKAAIGAAIILVAFICGKVDEECGGKERWDVKTVQDKESEKIRWTPIASNIKTLRALTQVYPAKFDKSKRYGFEFNTYQIDCKIVKYLSEDDGDYHLVLVDPTDSTKTIIGEIPNPTCERVAKSKYAGSFSYSRKTFESYEISKNKVADGVYRVVGVCFFDKIHGQTGVAPNGIELHPIMDIERISR